MITRNEFLGNESVKVFTDWLVQHSERGFSHKYCVIPKGKASVTESWSCNSIYNAYEKYFWNFSYEDRYCKCNRNVKVSGSTFNESEKSIAIIKEYLSKGINSSEEDLAYNASCMMLDWGGVLKRGRKGNTNEDKLSKIKKGISLVKYFKNVKTTLNPNTTTIKDKYSVIGSDDKSYDILMNSGFTKIYSILMDDFIIYDARVGAALGLLVSQWAKHCSVLTGIDFLKFAYGNAAKSAKCLNNEYRRNPSNDALSFLNMFQGNDIKRKSVQHIHNNIKASWLIKQVLKQSPENSLFNQLKSPMRAFEAALFMIGGCTYYACERNNL